jgi:hypothetical protein
MISWDLSWRGLHLISALLLATVGLAVDLSSGTGRTSLGTAARTGLSRPN